jgi:hypothetical protein
VNGPTIVDSLLLTLIKPKSYFRVGLLKVSLDLKGKLPQGIKEYSRSEARSGGFDTVFLYEINNK